MATVTWTPTDLAPGGMTNTPNGSLSAADTFRWLNDGRCFLHARKTGAGACTLTITTPATVGGGLTVQDPTVNIPASTGDVMFGPFRPDIYNDSNGYCSIGLSETTGLTVAVVRFPAG